MKPIVPSSRAPFTFAALLCLACATRAAPVEAPTYRFAEVPKAWEGPIWVEFLPELPKTATGKIQRFKLRNRD